MPNPIADLMGEINALIMAINKLAAAEKQLTGGMNNTRLNGSTKTEWVGDQARNNLGSGHNQQNGWGNGLLAAAAASSALKKQLGLYDIPQSFYQDVFKDANHGQRLLADINRKRGYKSQFIAGQLHTQMTGMSSEQGAPASPFKVGFAFFERGFLSKASGGARTQNRESYLEKAFDYSHFIGLQGSYKAGQTYEKIRESINRSTIADRMRDPRGARVPQGGGGGILGGTSRFVAGHWKQIGLSAGYHGVQAFKEWSEQSVSRVEQDPNAAVYRPLSPLGMAVGGTIQTAAQLAVATHAFTAIQAGVTGVAAGTSGFISTLKVLGRKSLVAGAVLGAAHGMYKFLSGEYKKEFEETKEGMREIGAWRDPSYEANKKFAYMRMGIKGTARDIESAIFRDAETQARRMGYGTSGVGGFIREMGNVATFGWVKDKNTLVKEAIADLEGRIKRTASNLSEANEHAARKNFNKYASKLAQASAEMKDLANPAWKNPKKLYQNMQAARLASRNYGSGLFTRGRVRIGD